MQKKCSETLHFFVFLSSKRVVLEAIFEGNPVILVFLSDFLDFSELCVHIDLLVSAIMCV